MLKKFIISIFISQFFFFSLWAKELSDINLEKHIIFCQKDILEPTKIISDKIKSTLSINNDKERTKIINVYSEGLLKKYVYTILQNNRDRNKKEKSRSRITSRNREETTQHFFYVIVEPKENPAVNNMLVYPDIKILIKEYKYLGEEIINTLKDKNYSITNNKNTSRYYLRVEIKDILKTNAP
jgi:predicted nucleic acid-binding Zn ribbon protein